MIDPFTALAAVNTTIKLVTITLMVLTVVVVLGSIGYFVYEATQKCAPNCGYNR